MISTEVSSLAAHNNSQERAARVHDTIAREGDGLVPMSPRPWTRLPVLFLQPRRERVTTTPLQKKPRIQLLKTQQNFTKKIRRLRSKEWLGMEADALQNPHKETNHETGKTAYTIPVPMGGFLLSRVALGFACAISVCHDTIFLSQ
jgi:hypothetical protein